MECNNCGGEDKYFDGEDWICNECGYNITQDKFEMTLKQIKYDLIKAQVEQTEGDIDYDYKVKDVDDIHDILLNYQPINYIEKYNIEEEDDGENYEAFWQLIKQIDIKKINEQIWDALEWGMEKIKL
jgi:hypothetical protein